MDGTYQSTLIVTFTVLLAATDAVVAKTVYVNPNAVGARDGSSRADAFTNIQDGIDSASPGDAVIIAPARYTGDRNRDLSFHGKSLTVRSTAPSDSAVVANTIIDCSGSLTSPHRGFAFDSGEGADSVLDGLVIASRWAPSIDIGGRPIAPGGAVLCVNASPTIDRCMAIPPVRNIQVSQLMRLHRRPPSDTLPSNRGS